MAGKASMAGVAAKLAELSEAELEMVATAVRQPGSKLRQFAAAAGAQLVT